MVNAEERVGAESDSEQQDAHNKGTSAILNDCETLAKTREHPRADEICRQVDYYFSDENLSSDEHLIALMCGANNLPVSLDEILNWGRMRQYRPKSEVIEAVKKCVNVQVLDDRRIQRLQPYVPRLDHTLDGIATISSSRTLGGVQHTVAAGYEMRDGLVVKVKTKKVVVTGFEEGYTEGPLSLEDQTEDLKLYHDDEPFSSRIEIAIYRFVSRRKFSSSLRDAFDAFLRFGGITIAPPQYTGSKADLKDMDASYKAQMLGAHLAPQGAGDLDKYEVDFLTIAQCYLGNHAVNRCDEAKIEAICKVMTNFYNYLLLHNVCPEYSQQLRAARNLVMEAQVAAIPMMRRFLASMPSKLNQAFAVLSDQQTCTPSASIDTLPSQESIDYGLGGICTKEARALVLPAVLALGSDEVANFVAQRKTEWHRHIGRVKTLSTALEVMSVEAASASTTALYSAMAEIDKPASPIGIVTCRHWEADLFTDLDCPSSARRSCPAVADVVHLWLEDHIISDMQVGIKFQCDLSLFELGSCFEVWMVERVGEGFCSFYTPTLNELMPSGKGKTVKWRVERPEFADWE